MKQPHSHSNARALLPGIVVGVVAFTLLFPEMALAQDVEGTSPVQRLTSFVGLFVLIGLAWGLSEHRDKVDKKLVAWGLGLQFVFALFVLKTSPGLALFSFLNKAAVRVLEFTADGSKFLFGPFMDDEFSIALNVLPTIIFFSSLMAVLYHLRIMQPVIRGLAWIMERTLGTSGAETLSAAANIFVGQTEAPLVVRPFIERMTRSELMSVMVGGFATVAGAVLAAYVGLLKEHFPDIGGHLIAASVMSAPAALVVAKLLLPETEEPETAEGAEFTTERVDANVIDAAARGASEGLKLALNVGAMLLAFLALIAMANFLLSVPVEMVCEATGTTTCPEVTIQGLLGYVFVPLAWVMGVPSADCLLVGQLLGEKIVLNEFVAFSHLAQISDQLNPRSVTIASYALCGFANFGSIAIQLGGIGGLAESRRGDLAKLGLKAMIGGTIAACMTACVAGALL